MQRSMMGALTLPAIATPTASDEVPSQTAKAGPYSLDRHPALFHGHCHVPGTLVEAMGSLADRAQLLSW